MANVITVRVKAGNPKIFAEKFLTAFTDKETEEEKNITDSGDEISKKVDFNILLPQPADLDIESGSRSYQDENNYYEFQKVKVQAQKELITPLLEQTYKQGMTQEEYVNLTLPRANGVHKIKFMSVYGIPTAMSDEEMEKEITTVLQGFYNLKTYGATDWYNWRIKNWGTKWNAETTYVDEESGFAEFTTRWSCPFEILEELAKYTDIIVSYTDEDMGSNYGVYTIKDGVMEYLIESENYQALNGTEKVQALATATALTQGEVYDLNKEIFGCWDDEEMQEHFGLTRETALEVANQAVKDTQEIVNATGLNS